MELYSENMCTHFYVVHMCNTKHNDYNNNNMTHFCVKNIKQYLLLVSVVEDVIKKKKT